VARTAYQQQLEGLRADVLAMSDVAYGRLRAALEALESGNVRRAERVIEGDSEINRRYFELEGECIELFALQQPVAGDLRFIASSFKIVTDLERVGDLAANLGRYTTEAGYEAYPNVDLGAIGDHALESLEVAMNAYARDDVEASHEVAAMDDHLDELCEDASTAIIRDLLAREMAEDAILDEVTRTLLVIRDLERVGDHAVNVAARTLYMVENDDALLY